MPLPMLIAQSLSIFVGLTGILIKASNSATIVGGNENEVCALYNAPSTLRGAGRGLFVGKNFNTDGFNKLFHGKCVRRRMRSF